MGTANKIPGISGGVIALALNFYDELIDSIKNINLKDFKNVDHIHFFGYYIGNYPSLTKTKIKIICQILNNIKYD